MTRKRWSQRVTERSDALDLEAGVFTGTDPRSIARSLKRSADRRRPRAVSLMSMEADAIPVAVAIGVGATLVMDLWNLLLKRAFGIPSLDYCLLGRWLRHMPEGTLRHARIAAAPPKPLECTVGWVAHYTIGVVFAIGFVLLVSGDWLARPALLPALLYGLGTVVFPFFIMQPSLGLGVAGSRTPDPTQARVKSLVTHCVFGVGLYLGALGMSYVLRGPA